MKKKTISLNGKRSERFYLLSIAKCTLKDFRTIYFHLLLSISNLFSISDQRLWRYLRKHTLMLMGIKLGNDIFIDSGFKCIGPTNISFHHKISLGHDNHFWAFSQVTIESYVQSAKDLLIIAGTHTNDSFVPISDNTQEVVIGSGCWLGARVTILGGTVLGKGCIVGAGSVVKGSFPDFSIIAGVPAKVIKQRHPSQNITSPFGDYQVSDLYL